MFPFLRKLGSGLITLWGVSLAVFVLLFVVPGWGKDDPADAMAQTMSGARATDANIKAIKEKFGLDKPLFFNWQSKKGVLDAQYPRFMAAALTNNLTSYRNGDRVFSAIWRRFPATMLLAFTALTIYLLAAIPIALYTAKSAGRFSDRAWLFLSILAISMPTFWLGRILQHYLGYETGLFSVGGAREFVEFAFARDDFGHRRRGLLFAIAPRQFARRDETRLHPRRARARFERNGRS